MLPISLMYNVTDKPVIVTLAVHTKLTLARMLRLRLAVESLPAYAMNASDACLAMYPIPIHAVTALPCRLAS
jgi:hypothetical protein